MEEDAWTCCGRVNQDEAEGWQRVEKGPCQGEEEQSPVWSSPEPPSTNGLVCWPCGFCVRWRAEGAGALLWNPCFSLCSRGNQPPGSQKVSVPDSSLPTSPSHKSQVISLNAPPAGDVGS